MTPQHGIPPQMFPVRIRGAGERERSWLLGETKMKAISFCSLLMLAAAGFVICSSEVKESISSYSCCESKIKFSQQCENIWDVNKQPFARSKGDFSQCTPPCKEIDGGQMTLSKCVSVNVTIVCNKSGVTVEERIYYYGQRCPNSLSAKMAPGNQGSVVLLLSALIAGSFLQQMIN